MNSLVKMFLVVVFLLWIFSTLDRSDQFIDSVCRNRTERPSDYNYNLSNYKYQCPQHRYTTRLIQRSPWIVYIENFLTANEIQHLIRLGERSLKGSLVSGDDGKTERNDYRTSSTAILKRRQTPIVQCIEERFADFQGGIDPDTIEPLQVVRYTSKQEFKPHFDWFSHADLLKNGGQRITTFFTYLRANCTQGETEFVDIPFVEAMHRRFCDILTCNNESSNYGLRFRPIPGNSIFWFNVDTQGNGEELTYHAGLPPGENGLKIGLNTWTRDTIFNSVA